MAERGEDFSDYVWGFVDNKPIINRLDHWRNVPAKTPLSEQIAKDMKKRGFKFCGPVIVYAVMQAMGMVNDHEVSCPRHMQIQKLERARKK
jgi:DNA-3-methyladenine glycosylase I